MGRVSSDSLKKLMSLGGTRIEIGDPFPVQGGKRFMCLAKVVGNKYNPTVPSIQTLIPSLVTDEEELEPTQTLCVISEEGRTPEEARAKLTKRLASARSRPTSPPARPRRGWLGRLILAFK